MLLTLLRAPGFPCEVNNVTPAIIAPMTTKKVAAIVRSVMIALTRTIRSLKPHGLVFVASLLPQTIKLCQTAERLFMLVAESIKLVVRGADSFVGASATRGDRINHVGKDSGSL